MNWFAAVRSPVGRSPTESTCCAAVSATGTRTSGRSRADRPGHRAAPRPLRVAETAVVRAGNVALIGDAAHSMAPNLGRGACEAMVDAATLGRLLTRTRCARCLAALRPGPTPVQPPAGGGRRTSRAGSRRAAVDRHPGRRRGTRLTFRVKHRIPSGSAAKNSTGRSE
ncbi:hypothetical protein GS831_24905 [Rhodococcus hoagii]|nr:hypothetical protein [Prescottella equi]